MIIYVILILKSICSTGKLPSALATEHSFEYALSIEKVPDVNGLRHQT